MKVKLYDTSVMGKKVEFMFEDKKSRLHSVSISVHEDEKKNGFAKKTLEVLGFRTQDLNAENLETLEASASESRLDYNSVYNLTTDRFNNLTVIQKING